MSLAIMMVSKDAAGGHGLVSHGAASWMATVIVAAAAMP
jgi:hypothetical protein